LVLISTNVNSSIRLFFDSKGGCPRNDEHGSSSTGRHRRTCTNGILEQLASVLLRSCWVMRAGGHHQPGMADKPKAAAVPTTNHRTDQHEQQHNRMSPCYYWLSGSQGTSCCHIVSLSKKFCQSSFTSQL
jgi:hypothetical protein